MRALVFSDIHGDYRALERLMETEADYYFAAGDLTSWGRGLDRCGEILQRRAGRVYVLPGNHESADQTSRLCQKFGLIHFHEQSIEAGGYHIAGFGYSNPTPFNTPGEYTEEEIARRLNHVLSSEAAGADLPLPSLRDAARPGPGRASTWGAVRSRSFWTAASRRPSSPGISTRRRGRRRWWGIRAASAPAREAICSILLHSKHDDRRSRARLPSAPPASRSCAELSLTPPRKERS